jgi:hypothetical protein
VRCSRAQHRERTYNSLKRGENVCHDIGDIGFQVHAQCVNAEKAKEGEGDYFFTVKRT